MKKRAFHGASVCQLIQEHNLQYHVESHVAIFNQAAVQRSCCDKRVVEMDSHFYRRVRLLKMSIEINENFSSITNRSLLIV